MGGYDRIGEILHGRLWLNWGKLHGWLWPDLGNTTWAIVANLKIGCNWWDRTDIYCMNPSF